jgi:antitoxin MazE
MNVAIVRIGNSKGLRIPKSILKKYNITDEVELVLEQGYIIIKPIAAPRKGWNQAFQEMNNNGDDDLLIEDSFEDENWEEWK